MKYSKFTPEEIQQLGDGLWSRGHTDLGTITLLFRQPVAALQIKDHQTGAWKWAKPLDGSLTVNACDALSFLTGGYVQSTIHRVILLSLFPSIAMKLTYSSRYLSLRKINSMLIVLAFFTLRVHRTMWCSRPSTLPY